MKLGLGYVQKKKSSAAIFISLILLLAFSFGCTFTSSAQAEEFTKPEQIILTWTTDPTSSQTITWLMSSGLPAKVQYITADEFNGNFDFAQEADVNGTTFGNVYYRYTVNLNGLAPDTKYIYRVGNEVAWSDTLSFTTAADTENFSFLYMGDVQDGYAEWGSMVDSLYQDYPEIKFSLLGGDLTNSGYDENEWGQFLDAATGVFSQIPMMPTLGNHDGAMYSNFFSLPDNGPEGLTQKFYSFDYGDAHFVVLDSSNNTNEAAKQWLQEDLQNTTKKWKIAVFHIPAYPAAKDYKGIDKSICENWVPILEQNYVDMVFVGHQHVYMRTHPIYQGKLQTDPQAYGIVYVMGNAGSKTYAGGGGFFYIAREETGSNYQVISIDGNVLTLTAKKANGELIESYTINKVTMGAPTLEVDTTNNLVGQAIELTFTDDVAWRTAITDITVNGSSIAGKYSITSGKINIDAGVFTAAGSYPIVVKATGYTDATVTQTIQASSWIPALKSGYITTVAGNGTKGYSGDDGPATSAQLSYIPDVAVDCNGNIYIADCSNNVIRMVPAQTGTWYGIPMMFGNIYTVAGNGTRGYSGDDGPATNAQLGQVEGIAVDSAGNIYITDVINSCVRKIDPSGIITTVAQVNTPRGVAVDNAGNIYIGCGANNFYGICMLAAETGTMHGIPMTAGNIYTVAGTGTPGYSGDGGPATSAQICGDGVIAIDRVGNLYIADVYNYRVRKVDPSGIITTVAGTGTSGCSGDNGPATSAQIYPLGIAVDSVGNLYISGSNFVRKVNSSGIITTVAGTGTSGYSGDNGPATSAQLISPWGIEVDSADNLYIADSCCVRYVKLSHDGVPNLATLSLSGSPDLSYSGTTINYDLSGLTLTGTDQFGLACDITGQTATWAVHSGPATVSGSTLTITGSGTINVSASIHNITSNIFSLTVTDSGANPPTLIADPNDKIIGQDDVKLTFTDDPAWRESINTLNIDGVVLDAGKYSKDSPGEIIISGDVFQKAGDYFVEIKATGYSDTSVVQTIVSGEVALQIIGDGVITPLTFTMAQLEEMNQYKHLYSTINKWPSKKWFVGEGVSLTKLLSMAGIKEDAKIIKFTASDGYKTTFTVQELLNDKRYLFPYFKEPEDGHIPGSAADAEELENILALKSANSNDFNAMNDNNALRLVVGQRAVSEQVNDTYVKYVNRIEVLTTAPKKWENPQANPEPGIVPAGTMVKLSTSDMNGDKVYYTTDGSTPTLNSIMYNPIGSEWWSSRQDVLNTINHPIEIKNNTIIRAIAIGPGKEDSDVVTFNYEVSSATPPILVADTTNNIIGNSVELTFTDNETWRKAITKVMANSSILANDEYSLAPGKITIDANVFAHTGTYTIVIEAEGYSSAIIAQLINEAPVQPEKPQYNIIPEEDPIYTIGATPDGIKTMTLNADQTGFKYFAVFIEPVKPHEGEETTVFTHVRNDAQLGIGATVADFDVVDKAKAGFNVNPGDVVKVYIVDQLTNDANQNPIVLQ